MICALVPYNWEARWVWGIRPWYQRVVLRLLGRRPW